MIKRTTKNLSNVVLSEEAFTYDAAGNITDAPDTCFAYDVNNRLTTFNGNDVSYDLDGNMLSNGSLSCSYDSANRLVSAGGHTYTYNAEDVRIRNLCCDADTAYVYDTNSKLSKLLCKTTNGIATKYVYGKGLIGEEKCGVFKTYHFDSRGSTVAITDMCGNITDTFAYDTYGKLISRTGSSFVIFGYNGRDGVVTDKNGLIYMRARYYSPDMKRFVNADIVAGAISNAITLNRFAYANGNPVSFIDPFGLKSEDKPWWEKAADAWNTYVAEPVADAWNTYVAEPAADTWNTYVAEPFVENVAEPACEYMMENVVIPAMETTINITQDIINYDEDNSDVQKVYDSHYFSSYNGTFVIRHSSEFLTSWAIGNMIFLNHDQDPKNGEPIGPKQTNTLNHEYGHIQQYNELEFGKYMMFVAIPSMCYNLASRGNDTLLNNYYNMPWEYDADSRSKVNRGDSPTWAEPIRDKYFELITK